ncbi:unnamed protein product [Effrenium voratum]|nr:unnamed protein product [Effrenium voratum]
MWWLLLLSLAHGIMDPDEQEKRLAWKYLDCANLLDEHDRLVDWPGFRRYLLETPYPANMDAVFDVLNRLSGSSSNYDEEARVCLMGVPAAFFYLTHFTLDTMEKDEQGRPADAEAVKKAGALTAVDGPCPSARLLRAFRKRKATLQYSVFENYISALHPGLGR